MLDDLALGMLWFDAPSTLLATNGVGPAICVRGDGQVVRLHDPFRECASLGPFWWTNVPFQTLSKLGLQRRKDLRNDTFLLTRPEGLVAEMGLRDAPIQHRAVAAALQLRLVLSHAAAWFDLPTPPPDANLAAALRHHLFNFGEPVLGDVVGYAFRQACQDVARADDPPHGWRKAVLRHHRQDYAIRMLDVHVPAGEWAEVYPPADVDHIPRWVKDTSEVRPLVLRVSAQFHSEHAHALSRLTGLGGAVARTGRPTEQRSWIAAPEYLALCPHAEMTVHGALAAERYQPNPYRGIDPIRTGPLGHDPILCGPLQLGGGARMSYSVGIVCEAMWTALVRTGTTQRDAVAMWLTAHDQAECLRTAIAILDLGYPLMVTGYARGRVWLAMPDDLDDAEADAMLATVAACCRIVPPTMAPARPATPRLRVAGEMAKRARRERPRDPALAVGAVAVLGDRTLADDLLRMH